MYAVSIYFSPRISGTRYLLRPHLVYTWCGHTKKCWWGLKACGTLRVCTLRVREKASLQLSYLLEMVLEAVYSCGADSFFIKWVPPTDNSFWEEELRGRCDSVSSSVSWSGLLWYCSVSVQIIQRLESLFALNILNRSIKSEEAVFPWIYSWWFFVLCREFG